MEELPLDLCFVLSLSQSKVGFLEGLGLVARLLELQTRSLFRTNHLAVSLKLVPFILASVVIILVFLTSFVPRVILVYFFADLVIRTAIMVKKRQ